MIGSMATVVSFFLSYASCGDESLNRRNSYLGEFEVRGKFSAAEVNSSEGGGLSVGCW